MLRNLTIDSKPYHSSRLAIPPSPFSPQLPITPPTSPPAYRKSTTLWNEPKHVHAELLEPLPVEPLAWVWKCCKCRQAYQLGATRRCLNEGHYFCSGKIVAKRNRKTGQTEKVRLACESEFDYQGWKYTATWRRKVVAQAEAANQLLEADESTSEAPFMSTPSEEAWLAGHWKKDTVALKSPQYQWKKDCWNLCDYPSECRWGKSFGVKTPILTDLTASSSPATLSNSSSHIEDASGESAQALVDGPSANAIVEPSISLPPKRDTWLNTKTETAAEPSGLGKPDLEEVKRSAERRKRRSAGLSPSPLALTTPSATADSQSILGGPLSSKSDSYMDALDDLGNDLRKGFERMGTQFLSNIRITASSEETKLESRIKALRPSKKSLSGSYVKDRL